MSPGRWIAVVAIASSFLACAPASNETPDESASANGISFSASAAAREALGVEQWTLAPSETVGYGADRHRAFSMHWETNPVSEDRDLYDVVISEDEEVSHVVRNLDKRADSVMFTDVRRDVPHPQALERALSLLEHDLDAAFPDSTSTVPIGAASLHIADLTVGVPALTLPNDLAHGLHIGFADPAGNKWLIQSLRLPDGLWQSVPPGWFVPPCPGNTPLRVLQNQFGHTLESLTAEPPRDGHNGRLYLSDDTGNRILVMNAPDEAPQDFLTGVDTPGGLLWLSDQGKLLAGISSQFSATPQTGLSLIDPRAPAAGSVVARGLTGSNGVARAPDGTIFTTSFAAGAIDKVSPAGVVTKRWASVAAPNGISVDAAGRYLYVNQSPFGTIVRVKIDDPSEATPFFRTPLLSQLAFLDGSTIDEQDRLYVANWLGAAVWRISPDGTACALAHDLRLLGASMTAVGGGGNFPTNHLYVSTHTGLVIELPNAVR
jgi:sugar lactone lactonase YvrE